MLCNSLSLVPQPSLLLLVIYLFFPNCLTFSPSSDAGGLGNDCWVFYHGGASSTSGSPGLLWPSSCLLSGSSFASSDPEKKSASGSVLALLLCLPRHRSPSS